ncbi:hypothetical protein V5T82_13515 [Magnetovibrio sp. PR-2]|uniref:hypothetical protein n=1 Tax=Magnetovibrio sp. PR-2 TaxID=3120356 RepID=UPI002FCE2FE4
MKRLLIATVAVPMVLWTTASFAQTKVSQDEINMCLETIAQMSGGTPPESAVKLCKEGKIEDAIAMAMTGG